MGAFDNTMRQAIERLIGELQANIEALANTNANQAAEITALKSRLSSLEGATGVKGKSIQEKVEDDRIHEQINGKIRRLQEAANVVEEETEAGSTESIAFVTGVGNDTLTCNFRTSEGGQGNQVTVAKPFRLRRSTFNGLSKVYDDGAGFNTQFGYTYINRRKRVATRFSDSATSTQVLTPDYYDGEMIHIQKRVTGINGAEWQADGNDGKDWADE